MTSCGSDESGDKSCKCSKTFSCPPCMLIWGALLAYLVISYFVR